MLARAASLWVSARRRSRTLGELLGFLWGRRLFWLIPLVVLLLAVGLVVILATQSPLTPFVYTLF